MINYPQYSLDLVGRSDDDPSAGNVQTSGVQFAVLLPSGERRIYGDQSYVAHGVVLKDHPDGRVVWRPISISYGEWQGDPTDELLTRARTFLARCGTPLSDRDVPPTDLIRCLVAEIERLRGGGS